MNKNSIQNSFEKTKNAIINKIDQDGDGKLGKSDFSKIAEKVSNTAKKTASSIKQDTDKKRKALANKAQETASTIKQNANDRRKEIDLKKLKPIFEQDLNNPEFKLPNVICIKEIDKKHLESDVCIDSIGHFTIYKDMKIVTIYPDKLNLFNIILEPTKNSPLYYRDPYVENKYVAMEEYFDYINTNQIDELESIAIALGAKYFRAYLMEERKSFKYSSKERHTDGKYVVEDATISVDTKRENTDYSSSKLDFKKENDLVGHNPERPNLTYLKNSKDIENLINARMKKGIERKLVILKLKKFVGINQNEAAKIDGAMKILEIKGNTTISNEFNDECRKYIEYEVVF